jgi:hypothetical protein
LLKTHTMRPQILFGFLRIPLEVKLHMSHFRFPDLRMVDLREV